MGSPLGARGRVVGGAGGAVTILSAAMGFLTRLLAPAERQFPGCKQREPCFETQQVDGCSHPGLAGVHTAPGRCGAHPCQGADARERLATVTLEFSASGSQTAWEATCLRLRHSCVGPSRQLLAFRQCRQPFGWVAAVAAPALVTTPITQRPAQATAQRYSSTISVPRGREKSQSIC
jgi:hypothetical protein